MAARKKKVKRGRKSRPMQVVSLKAALHMVKRAERQIRARRMSRKNPDYPEFDEIGCGPNPVRHIPKMTGRGRPAKNRKWDMVTRFKDGAVAEKKFKATKEQAYAKARRLYLNGWQGRKVAEIILDDGK